LAAANNVLSTVLPSEFIDLAIRSVSTISAFFCASIAASLAVSFVDDVFGA